jgi:2'-5' RNA ligase
MTPSSPLILTLKLDHTTFEGVDRLRQQHFPPERNFIPAHVTLFHALPDEHKDVISEALHTLCSQTSTLPIQLPTLRFLGQGVAIDVNSAGLLQVRQTLAKGWRSWLRAQDQQGYRPHITIQNKVPSPKARQLYDQLRGEWQSMKGEGTGLLLWYYRGGPWELAEEFAFAA